MKVVLAKTALTMMLLTGGGGDAAGGTGNGAKLDWKRWNGNMLREDAARGWTFDGWRGWKFDRR